MFVILYFATNNASRLSRHAGISSQRISQGSTSPSLTLEISYRVGGVNYVPTAEGYGVQLHASWPRWFMENDFMPSSGNKFSDDELDSCQYSWSEIHPNPSTAFSERLEYSVKARYMKHFPPLHLTGKTGFRSKVHGVGI